MRNSHGIWRLWKKKQMPTWKTKSDIFSSESRRLHLSSRRNAQYTFGVTWILELVTDMQSQSVGRDSQSRQRLLQPSKLSYAALPQSQSGSGQKVPWQILDFTAMLVGFPSHMECWPFLYGLWAETTLLIPYRSQGGLSGLAVPEH